MTKKNVEDSTDRLNRYWEAVLDVVLSPDFEGKMPSSEALLIAMAAMKVADEELAAQHNSQRNDP